MRATWLLFSPKPLSKPLPPLHRSPSTHIPLHVHGVLCLQLVASRRTGVAGRPVQEADLYRNVKPWSEYPNTPACARQTAPVARCIPASQIAWRTCPGRPELERLPGGAWSRRLAGAAEGCLCRADPAGQHSPPELQGHGVLSVSNAPLHMAAFWGLQGTATISRLGFWKASKQVQRGCHALCGCLHNNAVLHSCRAQQRCLGWMSGKQVSCCGRGVSLSL